MKLLSTLTVLALATAADAQVASAILREGDTVPGFPTHTITSLGNTASNAGGLSACGLNASDGSTTFAHIWVGLGATGAIARTESTIGNLQQLSFESFFGVSGTASVAYSPSCTNIVTGATGLDGVWLDDTVVAIEDDPIPSLPGKIWRFGSRPGVTTNDLVYWVGGIDDAVTGSSEGGGLFFTDGVTETAAVITGDVIAGLPPLDGNGIDFDVRFAPNGQSWIGGLDTSDLSTADYVCAIGDVASGVVTPITAGGGMWKEAEPMTAAQGGLPGENWDNFDLFGLNDSGSFMITGDTDGPLATDEFLAVDGVIRYREGDVVDGYTLTGAIEGAYLANDGQVAYVWDVLVAGVSREALFLDDRLLLKQDDLVDFDGDGFVESDSVVGGFTGITALSSSSDGHIAFIADINVGGVLREGYFVLDYQCLKADVYSLSVAAGGSQVLSIDAGPAHAGEGYVVVGSVTGTTPGIPFSGVLIPLNLDGYFNSTLAQANSPGYMMSLGLLDAQGRATATLTVPAGAPIPAGLTVHHAFVTFTLSPLDLTKASGPVSLITFP
ncbi:MAG: hypothetical protein WD226_03065 [Planctomycetota bacterium]